MLAMVGLLALALALRLPRLDESLFGDEVYTFNLVRDGSVAEMLRHVRQVENSPPLFFVLAWLARRAGDAQWWIRLPSLIAGTLTVPLVYLLGVRTVGARAGALGALLLALATFHVFYSTEARPYALAAFFVTISTLALLGALDTGRRRWWVVFALASAAAVYSHYTTAFVLAAQVGWVAWTRPDARAKLAVALAAAVALFAPWVPFLQGNKGLAVDAFYPFTARAVARDLAQTLPGHPFVAAHVVPGRGWVALFAAAIAVGAVTAAVRSRHAPKSASDRWVLVAACALATPIGLAAYSLVSKAIFAPRPLISSLPAACVALGALAVAARRSLATVLTLVLVGVVAISWWDSRGVRSRRQPWRDVAAFVDRSAAPGDAVVNVELLPVPDVLGHNPLFDSLAIDLRRPHPLILAPATGGPKWNAVAGAPRVYAVVAQLPGLAAAPAPPRLDARFRLEGRRVFRGLAPIAVFTYRPRNAR